MKRLLLLLPLLFAVPAQARGVLVIADSAAVSASTNYKPFFDLLERSLKPGMKLSISNSGGTNQLADGVNKIGPAWSQTELSTLISPTGTAPKYDYDMIVMVEALGDEYLFNSWNRPIPKLTLTAFRPQVPVLYLSTSNNFFGGTGGEDSTGCNTTSINLSSSSPLVTSPAGFAFPVATFFAKKSTTGNGDPGQYVTPVLTLACTNYTKADPDGDRGLFSNSACDTMCAWFWNPPRNATTAPQANPLYGFVNFETPSANSGGNQYPSSALSIVAVGMCARMAPACFNFPAQNVALNIDDGSKRFNVVDIGGGNTAAATYSGYYADAIAGFDSLGVWRIPYTLGEEVDSLGIYDSNGLTRFQNEFTACRKFGGYGRVTVHCHAGTGANGPAADTSLASASGKVFTDIWGVVAARYALIGPSAATRNQSSLWLNDGATRKLIDYAGSASYVSGCVMAPTDNYRSILASGLIKSDLAAGIPQYNSYDSLSYAARLSAAGYKGFPGYTVIRTQYAGQTYNYLEGGGTGGVARGWRWNLPSLYTIAAALDTPLRPTGPASILYASSQYLWGGTTDTLSTQDFGAMRVSMNQLLGAAVGWNRNYNSTTAQEAATAGQGLVAHRGVAKGVIWVTHIPNWRQAQAGPVVYGGGRPAWENTRLVHGVMEAAKWCALQANTSTTTYFTSGPLKWVYDDQITERDLR